MDDLDERLRQAVQHYWDIRQVAFDEALRKKAATGTRIDDATIQKTAEEVQEQLEGDNRSAVVSGAHIAKIEELFVDLSVEAGLDRSSVKASIRKLDAGTIREKAASAARKIPGYFRAEKEWDMLIIAGNELIAALEIKSQAGPSFGNNANNRIEEALGSATDLQAAFESGLVGEVKPFVGYFFLLEDCPKVHTPVKVRRPHFDIDPEFIDASYAQRYTKLAQRMVQKGLYDAVCLTLATSSKHTDISFPSDELNFRQFVDKLQQRVGSSPHN